MTSAVLATTCSSRGWLFAILKSWDVGITVHAASPVSPLFDFWRTDSEQTAMHIANTLASHFGCSVRITRRP